MEFNKKSIILLALVLVLGLSTGFYFGNNRQQKTDGIVQIVKDDTENKATSVATANNIDRAKQKLDLLKSYTDFVLLPPEKIVDANSYVEAMKTKIIKINDSEIISKFNASWETENGEQKRLDFIDFLNDKIKSDLQ
ncbi:MAG: hypothetical protein Q7U36_01470 [bacterium]|nr:hypothetical protein [bacterium]